MKISGQSLELNFVQPFSLPRPDGSTLSFQLSPLPLGFQANLRKRRVASPRPPIKVSRDSSGKPVRDASGLAVTQADFTDSRYLEESELYHQRVAVLAIVEALRNDPEVTFDASPPTTIESASTAWGNFADAIFGELEQAGLSAGDLIAFCDEICRISNMLDQHIRETQVNFSSPPPESSI